MWDDVFDSMSAFNRRNPLYGKHGKNMTKFEDGILKISLPKAQQKNLPPSGSISIE